MNNKQCVLEGGDPGRVSAIRVNMMLRMMDHIGPSLARSGPLAPLACEPHLEANRCQTMHIWQAVHLG